MGFLCGYPISRGVPGLEAGETASPDLPTCGMNGPMGTEDDQEALRPAEEACSGNQAWRTLGTVFGCFRRFGAVFRGFRGHRRVYVSQQRGACQPAEGSMSPRRRVHVIQQMGLCHSTEGCMSANRRVHVSQQKGPCHPAERYM